MQFKSNSNGMQIGTKGIENLLMIVMLKKKKTLKKDIQKTPFHSSLFEKN
jgi:hypothetical protein